MPVGNVPREKRLAVPVLETEFTRRARRQPVPDCKHALAYGEDIAKRTSIVDEPELQPACQCLPPDLLERGGKDRPDRWLQPFAQSSCLPIPGRKNLLDLRQDGVQSRVEVGLGEPPVVRLQEWEQQPAPPPLVPLRQRDVATCLRRLAEARGVGLTPLRVGIRIGLLCGNEPVAVRVGVERRRGTERI